MFESIGVPMTANINPFVTLFQKSLAPVINPFGSSISNLRKNKFKYLILKYKIIEILVFHGVSNVFLPEFLHESQLTPPQSTSVSSLS